MREQNQITLAEAIRALRTEVQESMRAGGSGELRLALDTVEIELQVEAERDSAGSGRIKFWVSAPDPGGSHSPKPSHTVRLSLRPASHAYGYEDRDVLVVSEFEERG